MNTFNRRRFLQTTAGALGAIGLNQLSLNKRANRYGSALAQSTQRKVALLVGVNNYERNKLGGAITDVELQKQLLIHRFGFKAEDVHTLKNEEATRLRILGEFDEYLYEPAKAGDVVVFHFSGHGDHVKETELMRDFTNRLGRRCIDNSGEFDICRNTAIAPADYSTTEEDAVQAIMGHTLLLMRAALAQKTENVTFILDCCYAGGGKRGNAVMRSLDSSVNGQITSITPAISNLEWEYQQSWLERMDWSEDDFVQAIQSPTGPGFFAGAAAPRQYAADYRFDGFIAGAFTYLLTQHLWQTTSPLANTIPTITSGLSRLQSHNQTPVYDPDLSTARALSTKTLYHFTPNTRPAEAVILGAKADGSDRLHLWLGGLDPQRLAAFDKGATFSVVDRDSGASLGQIQQVADTRDGLLTEGELVSRSEGLTVDTLAGQLLQEKTRGIPEVVVLNIALDDTLAAEEQTHVKTALGDLANFEIFSTQENKAAHVLLGRYTEEIDQKIVPEPNSTLPTPVIDSIGLFSATQEPLVTDSFGASGESIDAAITRLRSRFISLHIGRMLALMVNGKASKLDIDVNITSGSSRSGTTTRGGNPKGLIIPQQSDSEIKQIPIGQEIDVVVKNNESVDLHFGLLAIDSAGAISVLFPQTSDRTDLDVISSGSTKTEPLVAIEPTGIVELLVLASPQSLVGPLDTLRDKAAVLADPDRNSEAVVAADAVEGIFGALSTASETSSQRQKAMSAKNNPVKSGDVSTLLAVEDVAVLSLLFEIVP
ncbi:MAG: caspase family protein [Cyanobacteria bacterium J06634_5]